MSKKAPALLSRPARQRWSHVPRIHLSLEQVENNWAALGHSARLGIPPNASLDIHFHRGGLDDPIRNAGASLKAFLKSSRQWIERKGGETAIIWTMENRSGVGSEGVHAHILMHVPVGLLTRWHQLRRRWARKAGLEVSKAGVINFSALPTLGSARGKLRYMCKDIHPEALPIFIAGGRVHLDDRGKPSNAPIYGLKTGVSRNINAKARASYRPSSRAVPSGLAGGDGINGANSR
jgi:hypothetical protein